jgi:hypothetical protein
MRVTTEIACCFVLTAAVRALAIWFVEAVGGIAIEFIDGESEGGWTSALLASLPELGLRLQPTLDIAALVIREWSFIPMESLSEARAGMKPKPLLP